MDRQESTASQSWQGTTSPRSAIVFNVGSTSLKIASYALDPSQQRPAESAVETARAQLDIPAGADATALAAIVKRAVEALALHDITPDVVGHRIVHGLGRHGPSLLTGEELAALATLSPLAPLHQPRALAVVQIAMTLWPGVRQMGVYDTSFHRTLAPEFSALPLPASLLPEGAQRYGFHGLAFASALKCIKRLAPKVASGRVVIAHLGGGSSLCAVRDGRSVNTTMGMTPLDGLPMATRSGALDPGLLLYLQRTNGLSVDALEKILWQDSGLKGLSGLSGDMRQLLRSDEPRARLAIAVYASAVAQGIAAMATCIGGIDALVFSGGIGMHAAPVRASILDALAWLNISHDLDKNSRSDAELTQTSSGVRIFLADIDEEAEVLGAIAADEKAIASK